MKILVTGSAGFIGFHLVKRLLKEGIQVAGLDNLNEYYDVNLKYARLKESGLHISSHTIKQKNWTSGIPGYEFFCYDLKDKERIINLFVQNSFDYVIHLAAQAGVRYSLDHPQTYIDSNVTGFLNILEACRHYPVRHLIYASSSSVYGLNQELPYSEKHRTDKPASLYASTKKANEMMAFTYSHLFNIPVTGLRFFTVYGPWGRPDMAFFKFTHAILNDKPIDVYNKGNMSRDFTYIDDIIEGIVKILKAPPPVKTKHDDPPHRLFNIGNGKSVPLMEFIQAIEDACGKKAIIRLKEMQQGDVLKTHADVTALEETFLTLPKTDVKDGMLRFVQWYREYYEI